MLVKIWIGLGEEGFQAPSVHSQLRQIPVAGCYLPPACRQILNTFGPTVWLAVVLICVARLTNYCVLHNAGQEISPFTTSITSLSFRCASSFFFCFRPRTNRSNGHFLHPQTATIPSDANVALPLSSFRTIEEHVLCLWSDIFR